MKISLIKIITILLLVIVVGACRDEEKNPLPDFTRSSIPLFLQEADDTGFVNFLDLDATVFSFNVDRAGSEDVSSIDVLVTYNNSVTNKSQTVQYTTVTMFPQPVNLTIDELINLFPAEVVTRDSLSLGDSFIVGGNVLLEDGRYLEGGYSPNLVANEPVLITYNVACASDLGGVYDLTLIAGDNGELESIPNQRIDEIAPGYYEISEMTMDIFAGGAPPIKYRFTDICGNLTADASSVDFGTVISLKLNPGSSVDPVTGEITFYVEYVDPSCCGLPGIKTVFKATPK